MRIIAGSAGGRVIGAPPVGTRPTSDRVRESVFGMLVTRIDLDGARVLDLYAGSGALALEALSRGAAHATVVESDARAAATIARNATSCGVGTAIDIRRRRVAAALSGPVSDGYDLVFLDPPYALDDAAVADDLRALVVGGWCAPGAVVVVERSSRSPQTAWPVGIAADTSRRYGETRVDLGVVD